MNSGMAVITLTEEQIKERNEARDILHAHHGLIFSRLIGYLEVDKKIFEDGNLSAEHQKAVDLGKKALEYYNELLPSKGFWGRAASRLTQDNVKLRAELNQQRFNNAHNLSIDQKVADKISSLEAQVKELEEYKWKYEDLCK